jgi:hypothetical protein
VRVNLQFTEGMEFLAKIPNHNRAGGMLSKPSSASLSNPQVHKDVLRTASLTRT